MDNKEKIVQIFKQLEVPYWTSGNNVSDSVNIQCPFCNDSSNHCGVFINSLLFSCWRCSTAGPLEQLLHQLTGYSIEACKELVVSPHHSFKKGSLEQIKEMMDDVADDIQSKKRKIVEIQMPEHSRLITEDTNSKLLDSYLARRNISLSTLILHKCSICNVGYYMHRIIIPVFYNDILVSYQAADLTGRARVKYETAPGHINDYIYGIDSITGTRMIVVEGILDAWRVEDSVGAIFGITLTDKQKALILAKKLDELIFAFDGTAYWQARVQAKYFSCFINKVTVLKLPTNEDPDSMGKEAFDELLKGVRNEIGKTKY